MTDKDARSRAVVEARNAVAADPSDPAAHQRLARVLEGAGQVEEAEAHYREAASLQPEAAEPRLALAQFYLRRGAQRRAETVYGELAKDPRHRDLADMSLGNLRRRQGKPAEAAECYEAVLARNPNHAAAHNALGLLAADAGDWQTARRRYEAALVQAPRFASALSNLGVALHRLGRTDEAIAKQRAALAADPRYLQAYTHLAGNLAEKGRRDEAIAVYRKALRVDPKYLPALVNLANVLNDAGRPDEAIEFYARGINANPRFAPTYSNMAGLLKDQGRAEEALPLLERALKLKPDFTEAASNLLMTLLYSAERTPQAVAEAHFEIGRQFAAKAGPPAAHPNTPDPEKRLRIGYVSPDFRTHPVAFFIEPVLKNHGHSRAEVFAYANHLRDDATTARLRPLADQWRSIADLPDEAADALIRQDGIDILIDLAGHTARNRISLFARKPAPVQVAWLGYPATTGLPTVDYRITDGRADPEGTTEAWHTERLLRLPDCFLCYRPPPDCPEPAPPPATRAGAVTFASFNNPAKISPKAVELWSRVLTALPESRLVMKAQPFADRGPRAYFTGLFRDNGVDPARIAFVGRLDSLSEHLDYYRHIDIALDSFPYNGTTITCEAFYMGVPVLVREGAAHVSRVGVSIAHAIGADGLVAGTDDAFVAKAVDLANDLETLFGWRGRLRPMMRGSALMDAKAFTGNLETALRTAWRHWCEEHRR